MVFGQMSELSDLFETLKDQLDLPAVTITLQDLSGGKILFRKGAQHHHKLGIEQGFRLKLLVAIFARLASGLFLSQCNGRFALTKDAQPCGQRVVSLQRDPDFPRTELASLVNALAAGPIAQRGSRPALANECFGDLAEPLGKPLC